MLGAAQRDGTSEVSNHTILRWLVHRIYLVRGSSGEEGVVLGTCEGGGGRGEWDGQ